LLQLAANIKLIRQLSGLTQEDFGVKFNASRAMITSYESAKAAPDDLFLTRLSKYSGVPKEDLLDKALIEENIDVDKLENVFHGETVLRGTRNKGSGPKTDNYRDLYIESLKDQIKLATEQNEFLRRNFEFSLKSIALATHSTNAQVKTLTWFQAYTQAGGDPKKTAKVMDTLNNKMAEYSAVGDEMGIAKNS